MSEAIKPTGKTKNDMTKKHFIAIAAAIKLSVEQINNTYPLGVGADHKHVFALAGIRTTAVNTANTFAYANPRFDRARFLAACGIN